MTSDEALYQEARGGSIEAFTQLYNRFESPVFGFILKRIGNQQDAEEIFHDAMMTIVNGPLTRFVPGGFTPWLYKVAMNLSLNRIRSRQRRGAKIASSWQPDLSLMVADDRIVPEDEKMIHEEREQALDNSVSLLNKRMNCVYHLRRAGLSHEEIAARLGIPIGTVKSRSSSLVGFLKKEITKWNAK